MVKADLTKGEGKLSLSLVQVKPPTLKLLLFTFFLQLCEGYYDS